MSIPTLLFEMAVPKAAVKELIIGKLTVRNAHKNMKFLATSGCPRFQYAQSHKLKGRGQIPTPIDVGISSYLVLTTPLYLPHVRGIEGNGYPINPFWVEVGGIRRGDFLIHEDKNHPGSAGCVVITSSAHWKAFEGWMSEVRALGHKNVRLDVVYAYI